MIRAYAQEEAEMRGFDEPNREYVAKNVLLIRTWSMFMPSLTSLIGTTFLIVLWQGGYRILHGQMSLGALITFNTYLGFLVWPMIALGWVTNIFQRGAASMGRLNYILTAKPQIDDRPRRYRKPRVSNGEIEFRNLTFHVSDQHCRQRLQRHEWNPQRRAAGAEEYQSEDSGGFDAGDYRADGKR